MYFSKLLIANRGEIAVRIIRACRELGIATVAVYSEADRHAMHVRLADEAVAIGPAAATESYLRVENVVAAALRTGAQAIHPGYGFLSERAHFARACRDAGIVFVGPPPEAIELLGSKIAAKKLALVAHVPTAPAYLGDDQSPERLGGEAEQIGFPLLIKASAGGGGKGMRVVRAAADFAAALEGARREARAAFGDDAVLLEKLIERPRHVEIQVLCDAHGNGVHLFERECSIQRRHQKILEESPSPVLTVDVRAAMGAAAVRLALRAGYVNAGTVEFVVDEAGNPYFLEMNTRLQVEHPVTEFVTGLDLVQLQIAIAAGAPLPFTQGELRQQGHAIEVRIYAEDPQRFLPSIGTVAVFAPPEGPGIRNDAGIESGDVVTVNYDPMLAKLIVYAPDRTAAIKRLRGALDEYAVLGVTTNIPLLQAIAAHPAFASGETTTAFLDEHDLSATLVEPLATPEVLVAAALLDAQQPVQQTSDPWAVGAWRLTGMGQTRRYGQGAVTLTEELTGSAFQAEGTAAGAANGTVRVVDVQANTLTLAINDQEQHFFHARDGVDMLLHWHGRVYRVALLPLLSVDALGHAASAGGDAGLAAPMPGTVVKLLVAEGQDVAEGQPLVVIEAMKMEYTVVAPHAGVVKRLPFATGALVPKGAALIELSTPPTA